MRGVAVPYIIALILGVAVIGLVGYWFATSGGKFGGQSAKTICENKFLQYCITKSEDKLYSQFQSDVEECRAIDSSYTRCSELTGVIGGKGGQPPAQQQPQCKGAGEVCDRNDECCDNSCDAPLGGGTPRC